MLASVTITRNDWHSLEQWRSFYEQYRSAIDCHIIVDNASSLEYKEKLRSLFPDSILIERSENGGTTAAYNAGIKYIMSLDKYDSIMLIANDIRISASDVIYLNEKLKSEQSLGAISPILLQKDGETIATYGEQLSSTLCLLGMFGGQKNDDSLPDEVDSMCLPGGMCMVKQEVYRKIGLQDESLFMYSDENDFFHRATNAGYKLIAIRKAVAAHCHIPVEKGKQQDSGLALYYIYRNKLLICSKYCSKISKWSLFFKLFFINSPKYALVFLFEGNLHKIYCMYLGLFHGILGISGKKLENK